MAASGYNRSGVASMSFWIKFFKDAGIPAGEAANYAVVFSDNRIQQDMLPDLQKEYLSDMGISVMGDVIAILKHAKVVHSHNSRQRALLGNSSVGRTSPVSSALKSTPASRTVSHYINSTSYQPNPEPTGRMSMSSGMASRLGPKPATPKAVSGVARTKISFDGDSIMGMKEEVPVPKKRRVFPEHEGRYKISMPKGTTMKTKRILAQRGIQAATPQVFSRLGQESQRVKSGGSLGKIRISNTPGSSVFNRVSLKRTATVPTEQYAEDEDEMMEAPRQSLPYAGILKPGQTTSKRPKLVITKRVVPDSAESRLGPEVGNGASAGIFVGSAKKSSVRDRLGGITRAPATSTTPAIKKTIRTKPVPRVTFVGKQKMAKAAGIVKVSMVKQRLGPERNEVSSTTKGFRKASTGQKNVFSRLGAQKN